jgi:hypothetical protein
MLALDLHAHESNRNNYQPLETKLYFILLEESKEDLVLLQMSLRI